MPTAFGPREADRAKQLGLDPYEFAGYQERLREDYKSMLPSSLLRPRSSLGMGILWMLAEPLDVAIIGWMRVPQGTFAAEDFKRTYRHIEQRQAAARAMP